MQDSSTERKRRTRAARSKRDQGLELRDLGRAMGMHSVMFHDAVAQRLGLNITDHKCLDYILQKNGASAGEIARVTGLTTGAVTGVIDRLERAGFVRREADPDDRRRVMVVPLPGRLPEIGRLFEGLGQNMERMLSRYNARESQVIIDFMRRAGEIMRQENLRLRERETNK